MRESVPELASFEVNTWFGLFAPASTPAPVVQADQCRGRRAAGPAGDGAPLRRARRRAAPRFARGLRRLRAGRDRQVARGDPQGGLADRCGIAAAAPGHDPLAPVAAGHPRRGAVPMLAHRLAAAAARPALGERRGRGALPLRRAGRRGAARALSPRGGRRSACRRTWPSCCSARPAGWARSSAPTCSSCPSGTAASRSAPPTPRPRRCRARSWR